MCFGTAICMVDPAKINYAGEIDARPTETSETETASETSKRPTMTTKIRLEGGAPIEENDCNEA